MWIEIHYHQNDIVTRRGHLSIEQNRAVIGVIEPQVIVKMQRPIFFSDLIQARNPVLDVARRVPVALLELVLFRIEIFLASSERSVFAQFVSAVDAVQTREGGG